MTATTKQDCIHYHSCERIRAICETDNVVPVDLRCERCPYYLAEDSSVDVMTHTDAMYYAQQWVEFLENPATAPCPFLSPQKIGNVLKICLEDLDAPQLIPLLASNVK